VPLGEVTLQSALEAAWDGNFDLCYRRAQTAMTIAPDDLETMELMLRCSNAQHVLWEAEAWVRSAYAVRLGTPVVRYAFGITELLRGHLGDARKLLEKLAPEAPVAAYQGAIAAQLDDDVGTAERMIGIYVKARPADPVGRQLQAEIVCAIDLVRCAAVIDTIRSSDDDETAIARRIGAGLATPISIARNSLVRLTKDASTLQSAAFADAYEIAAVIREGVDPAGVLVRSPRSGRPEPGPGVDLAKDARPMAKLPFVTRVTQLSAQNDSQAGAAFSRMIALFPTDLATYRLARKTDKTSLLARKELEKSGFIRWRVVAAAELARHDEFCDLVNGFWWNDRGPSATSVRARCDIQLDAARGRKIADARLAVSPYGVPDVLTAIDGEAAHKDAAALEALARQLAKIAPSSSLVAIALFAAADLGGKKSHALYAEALVQLNQDPVFVRRVLHKYVETHDVPRAKTTIEPAIIESPSDAFLTGVHGEILLHEGKPTDALVWLTKSCVAARARRETDVLTPTLASIAQAVQKSKDKPARDAALKCSKGD